VLQFQRTKSCADWFQPPGPAHDATNDLPSDKEIVGKNSFSPDQAIHEPDLQGILPETICAVRVCNLGWIKFIEKVLGTLFLKFNGFAQQDFTACGPGPASLFSLGKGFSTRLSLMHLSSK